MTTEAQTPATGQPDTPTTATAGTLGVVIGKRARKDAHTVLAA